ncbi:adenosylcobinamide-phosphate synthase CbiB [Pelagibacterium limicola]|uniref:adenosylcobinamide-phosphate synthase CbiB n=1 Tax=Pelagibacterium limicola TaxID=2791022 RepID=UPI0018AF80C4|nr:adenosylcobinamide-phosphate synthase CbiB [Pelagibacterium limicola]
MSLLVALLAAIIERIAGYPQKLVLVVGHPVIWIGWLIGTLEARLNWPHAGFGQRQWRGVLALALVLAAVLVVSGGGAVFLRGMPFGWVVEAIIASSLLAQKGLRDAVLNAATPLRGGDIAAAREAVSHIVGRDTAKLDQAEISRAAIETLAENASDGVVAPLFYLALFGLPGAALYKAINTADSMIGHRSERYAAFGWAAAKLDDLVNFVPARLTAGLLIVMAATVPGASATRSFEAVRRDAKGHASPNAGWPESAMAGALGFGLGGPRAYEGTVVDLPNMGHGRRDLDADDIGAAVGLYDRMLWFTWAILGLLVILWLGLRK